jgi:4-hydroxybenzoate polyprenyltransferase
VNVRRAFAPLVDWGRMVKLSHTVFALPFALSAAAMAMAGSGWRPDRLPWILLAMFGARNAAMGFNRLVDHRIDARNPRTAGRELPAGRLGRRTVGAITIALTLLFVFACARLDLLWFAPIALAAIFGYSLTKRFTWTSHLFLGVALGLAPVGAWLAVAGTLSWTPLLLGAAVAGWTAGFDLIYACQDLDFDRGAGLHSLPARFGARAALWAARGLHLVTLGLMAVVAVRADLHPVYWLGQAAVAAILVQEHRLVRPGGDLSRLDVAFFNLNASVSVVYLLGVLTALGAAALR